MASTLYSHTILHHMDALVGLINTRLDARLLLTNLLSLIFSDGWVWYGLLPYNGFFAYELYHSYLY